MSSPSEPSDKSKPVVKEKNPHNYRKVGFSMIVISVSLVLIGLLVWSIGSNYHFASNIMEDQELSAMTPKAGYTIVLFDYTQPIGAKLKMLDHAASINTAQQLQNQYIQQNTDTAGQVLIIDSSESDNLSLLANAEVAAMTPKGGYNVILFNSALPVGAKLTLGIHENMLANATKYQKAQIDQIKDPDVTVVVFTTSFTDNLKMITGSSTPNEAFVAFANTQSSIVLSTQPTGNQSATSSNTTTAQPPPVLSTPAGASTEKASVNATAVPTSKSVTLNEKIGLNTTTSK
jgi:hypothetical protein